MQSKPIYKILVVDDEEDIRELLAYNLLKEGYEVQTVSGGKQAVEVAKTFKPDLVLLDIMMPDIDGVEVCRRLREMQALDDTFIFFLTARTEEYSEVAAFEAGANDFITKPIKPRALLSRMNAVLSRRDFSVAVSNEIVCGPNLLINPDSYIVTKDGQEIKLPKKEFELLSFLALNPNKAYSREELIKKIWGPDIYITSRTIDVHIRKVREKIGEDYIRTVNGVGYKFEARD